MNGLPRTVHYLKVRQGEGRPTRYAERGGGLFTSLKDMAYRIRKHKNLGRDVTIYESVTDWYEIDEDGMRVK